MDEEDNSQIVNEEPKIVDSEQKDSQEISDPEENTGETPINELAAPEPEENSKVEEQAGEITVDIISSSVAVEQNDGSKVGTNHRVQIYVY